MAPSARVLLAYFFFSSLCFASSTVSARKVTLDVYYETLCPFCSSFIVNHLARIFNDGLISAVDLRLVPFGNGRVDFNGSIQCQHGPDECLLNTVEACAIATWPDKKVHFHFIYCIERLVLEGGDMEWKTCFQQTGFSQKGVFDCFNSGRGEKLELQHAAQTNSLQPPHSYVPWVVVDGQPLYDDYEKFETYICKAYNGKLPRACEGLSMTISQEIKANQANRVCHVNEMINYSVTEKKHKLNIKTLI